MRYSMGLRVHATLLALFAIAMIVATPVQAAADEPYSFAELSAGGYVSGAAVGESDVSASPDDRSVLAPAGDPELKAGESIVTTEDGSVLKWKVDSSTTAKITGYVSLTTDLVVPSEIEGRSVIALGDMVVGGSPIPNSTFADNTVLETVHLPNSFRPRLFRMHQFEIRAHPLQRGLYRYGLLCRLRETIRYSASECFAVYRADGIYGMHLSSIG